MVVLKGGCHREFRMHYLPTHTWWKLIEGQIGRDISQN